MPDERTIAGLRCRDVLARLSDYVDGEISRDERTRVEDHLRGCDWCEKFGGEFTAVVAALRSELAEAPALDTEVEARLRTALAAATKE